MPLLLTPPPWLVECPPLIVRPDNTDCVTARSTVSTSLRPLPLTSSRLAPGPVIVQASILLGVSVLLEAALSFIGLGVQPPTPSLGLMLSTGRDFMNSSPWVVADPAVAILIMVVGFTLVGDGLRDWLDPRKRAIAR